MRKSKACTGIKRIKGLKHENISTNLAGVGLGTRGRGGRGGRTPGEVTSVQCSPGHSPGWTTICSLLPTRSAPTSPEQTDSKNEPSRCVQCLLIENVKCLLCLKAILSVSVFRREIGNYFLTEMFGI